MARRSECKGGGETRANGNCTKPGPDDLPVQCVGAWATDKHHYLRQYIGATRGVRAKFLPPQGQGGAAFIDLFAGPGMVRVRDTGEIREGSPLIALAHAEVPFSKVILCDQDAENASTLRARVASTGREVKVFEGDSNALIDEIAGEVPQYGLNFALVDPFGLQALKFSTLERLAKHDRMDLLVHFPIGDIKRNLEQYASTRQALTEALGTSLWESELPLLTPDAGRLIEIFKRQLSTLGYGSQDVRSEPIKNNQNLPIYYLVYASKSQRGDKIWQSITKNKPSGQREMF